jgi:gas vesicle protein
MADGYDRFENEGGSGGGSFVMGLLTGTVLGAGLGMLFAPKAGSELRGQLTEQAGNLANSAQEQYRKASEAAGDLADRGREMYDKARDAVSKGAEEAKQAVSKGAAEAQKYASSTPGSSYAGSGGSSYSSGSSSSHDSASDSSSRTPGSSSTRRSS